MDLLLNLKTLKKDTPWDLKKVSELITEIAVKSNDLSLDSLLPTIFSAIDLAKESALLKLDQAASLNDLAIEEVSKKFDELKVVAKVAAPALLKSLLLKKLLFSLSFCCSGESALKVIDQRASHPISEKKAEEKKAELV